MMHRASVADRLYCTLRRFRHRIPFLYYSIASRYVGKQPDTILDVGCGRARGMSVINRKRQHLVVGIDLHLPWLESCRREGYHKHVVLADARRLPFPSKSFGLVVCLEVLEH